MLPKCQHCDIDLELLWEQEEHLGEYKHWECPLCLAEYEENEFSLEEI